MTLKPLLTMFCVLSFFCTGIATAAVTDHQRNGYITGKVKRIYPKAINENQRIFFRLKGDPCKNNDTYWYFDVKDAVTQAWFSMLLTAAASDTDIKIKGQPGCNVTQSERITHIYQDF